MIREVNDKDVEILKKYLKNDKLQNPYFYIDVHSFGYKSENIKTYVAEENYKLYCFIYVYFNSVQLFVPFDYDNIEEITDFITEHDFEMISGTADIIKKIEKRLNKKYVATYGQIMTYLKNNDFQNYGEVLSQVDECREIAQLICSDEGIGGHYKVDILEKQLKERRMYYNCENIIIKENDKIVSHAATYANIEDMAIIGGVITKREYRGKGYGKRIVIALSQRLIKDEKQPILYCYKEQTINWYKNMGWNKVQDCGKLTKIRG